MVKNDSRELTNNFPKKNQIFFGILSSIRVQYKGR